MKIFSFTIKIIAVAAVLLVKSYGVFAQINFSVTVDRAKPNLYAGEKVYGVIGISFLQKLNSGIRFFPHSASTPVNAIWLYNDGTITQGWDAIRPINYSIKNDDIDGGYIRLWFHLDKFNSDGSLWGQMQILNGPDYYPPSLFRGKADKIQPEGSMGFGYKNFDYFDIPVSDFVYNNRHIVYPFHISGKNDGILFDISFQTSNPATNQTSPEVIHAGQAFTSLMQENKYVLDNAGKFNRDGISPSTNNNPNFGNGYYASGTKNGAFYYNSRKQNADNRTAIWGKIIEKYSTHNREHGDMGWPATSQAPTTKNNGEFAHFQNGSIYWSEATGSHTIFNPIKDKWNSVGGYEGKLGFPTTDGTSTNGKDYQEFEGGLIMGSEVYYKNTPLYKDIVSKFMPVKQLRTKIN